jgi:hypothetical protein
MPSTTGMKPGGYYNTHSDSQRLTIDAYLPWLLEAVADLPAPTATNAPLYLLDLGSSQGRNAIHAMRRVVEAIRKRSAAPVCVFFSDLPTNDFNQLFSNLFPAGPTPFADLDVFPAAFGTSAYTLVVPPRSLHIATSFNMIGWLDSRPNARLPRFIGPMGPSRPTDQVSVTAAEREPFRLQAETDLHAFYRARAQELVPGGKLLVQVFGRTETHSASDGLYDVLSDSLLELIDEGVLPRQFYEEIVFPIYFRTLHELTAPIETDSDLARAFRIDKAETIEVDAPFNAERARTGDIETWARSYTGFLRAVSEPVTAAALQETPDVAEVLEKLYVRLERLLVADPDRYEFRYISVGALLTRI